MGTSGSYPLPTTGNWPAAKRETTTFGTTGIASDSRVGALLGQYVQAHGGSSRAAQQMTSASHAGAKLAGFLAGVRRDGLAQALDDIGLGETVGQPVSRVLRSITDYLIGIGSLLEEDIVRRALGDFQDELFGTCNSFEELDTTLRALVEQDGLGRILQRFFGYCIYRRFCTHFFERLTKAAGTARSARRLLRDIKEFIFSKLKIRTYGHDLLGVEWRGSEGRALSEDILTSAWRVFGEE